MSAHGQFNTKNPTIKRILKEATELATIPSADLHATPLEDNLFEWHFTLRGPPSPSPYNNGLYHGRIILPPTYPLRPPSFRFLTPTGRFEVNREICLSISGHHEETWQPAWGIRTAMVAIRSFMDSEARGQLGGLDCDEGFRRKMAEESRAWRCAGCGRSNDDIIAECENAAKEVEVKDGEMRKMDEVPEELRLAYRDEMGKAGRSGSEGKTQESSALTALAVQDPATASFSDTIETSRVIPASPPIPVVTTPIPPVIPSPAAQAPTQPAQAAPQPTSTQHAPAIIRTRAPAPAPPLLPPAAEEAVPGWVDKAICGVLAGLAFMVVKKVLY
ncbi:MAG: hypothetical protein M1827_001550 [Pycnora praestabilis]|nr:MAG: hypothetical protein M1827_001550 [Pycnora praestabilis]